MKDTDEVSSISCAKNSSVRLKPSSTKTGLLRTILRGVTKRTTIWAYTRGYISFNTTESLFSWFDLRDI